MRKKAASATSIIFVHNHLSGDPTPSKDDLRIAYLDTSKISNSMANFSIHFLDYWCEILVSIIAKMDEIEFIEFINPEGFTDSEEFEGLLNQIWEELSGVIEN